GTSLPKPREKRDSAGVTRLRDTGWFVLPSPQPLTDPHPRILPPNKAMQYHVLRNAPQSPPLQTKHLQHMVNLLVPTPQHRQQQIVGGDGHTDLSDTDEGAIPPLNQKAHILPFSLFQSHPVGMTQKECDDHQIEVHSPARPEQPEEQQDEGKEQTALEGRIKAAAIGQYITEQGLQDSSSVQGINREKVEQGQHRVSLDKKSGPLLGP